MPLPRACLLAAVAVLALAGCAGPVEEATKAEVVAEDMVSVMVQLVTDNGNIGANADDLWCAWGQTTYTLRDGAGDIVATGDVVSDIDGEAEAGGEPALLGKVETTDPYECTLPFTVSAPRAEFYELEVAGQGPRSGQPAFDVTTTFEASEALSGYLDVEVAG